MRGRCAVTFPATFSVTRVDGRGQPRAAPAVRQPKPLAAARPGRPLWIALRPAEFAATAAYKLMGES